MYLMEWIHVIHRVYMDCGFLKHHPRKVFWGWVTTPGSRSQGPSPVLTWLPLLLPKRTGSEGQGWARCCPGTWQHNCCDTVNCSFWPLGLQFFLVSKSSYCISEMHPIILHMIDWKMLHLLERWLNNIVSTYKALSLKSFSGQHCIKIVKVVNQLLTNQD